LTITGSRNGLYIGSPTGTCGTYAKPTSSDL